MGLNPWDRNTSGTGGPHPAVFGRLTTARSTRLAFAQLMEFPARCRTPATRSGPRRQPSLAGLLMRSGRTRGRHRPPPGRRLGSLTTYPPFVADRAFRTWTMPRSRSITSQVRASSSPCLSPVPRRRRPVRPSGVARPRPTAGRPGPVRERPSRPWAVSVGIAAAGFTPTSLSRTTWFRLAPRTTAACRGTHPPVGRGPAYRLSPCKAFDLASRIDPIRGTMWDATIRIGLAVDILPVSLSVGLVCSRGTPSRPTVLWPRRRSPLHRPGPTRECRPNRHGAARVTA